MRPWSGREVMAGTQDRFKWRSAFSAKAVVSSDILQGQPVFHTFWTDVGDIDVYRRQGVKDDILAWLNMLMKSGVTPEWMIIVVETPENRKWNKFPSEPLCWTSLSKMLGDKRVGLMDPGKAEGQLSPFSLCFTSSDNSYCNLTTKFSTSLRRTSAVNQDPV
jgi:hypothetical protein